MKRDRKRINQIKKFWNLIRWRYCNKCKKEFVREAGWRMRPNNPRFPDTVVCGECCATIQDADVHFKDFEDNIRKSKWNKKR